MWPGYPSLAPGCFVAPNLSSLLLRSSSQFRPASSNVQKNAVWNIFTPLNFSRVTSKFSRHQWMLFRINLVFKQPRRLPAYITYNSFRKGSLPSHQDFLRRQNLIVCPIYLPPTLVCAIWWFISQLSSLLWMILFSTFSPGRRSIEDEAQIVFSRYSNGFKKIVK